MPRTNVDIACVFYMCVLYLLYYCVSIRNYLLKMLKHNTQIFDIAEIFL